MIKNSISDPSYEEISSKQGCVSMQVLMPRHTLKNRVQLIVQCGNNRGLYVRTIEI